MAAKVGDLRSGDRLSVFIDGLINPADTQAHINTLSSSQTPCSGQVGACYIDAAQLYKGFVGPNSDGNANDGVTIPVPPDQFDAVAVSASTTRRPAGCGQYPTGARDQEQGTGCAVIQLPVGREAPDLSASWDGMTAIDISLKSGIARLSTGAPVLLRVTGLSKKHTTLVYSGIMHTTTSTIARNIRVSLPTGFRLVCVDAQTIPPSEPSSQLKVPCPLHGTNHRSLSEQAAIELEPPARPPPKAVRVPTKTNP